jgi:Peroxiredoxin
MTNKRRARPAIRRPQPRRRIPWGLLTIVAVLAVGGVLVAVTAATRNNEPTSSIGTTAKDFTLPATDGRTVELSALRGHRVLLYFSEGVGCDGCWYQMTDLEKHETELAALDVRVLPIVVNDESDTRAEMARFGIQTPFLTDTTKRVSTSYHAIGTSSSMHANLPGHTFILVDHDGSIRWRGEYPQMFLDSNALLAKLRSAIAGKPVNDLPTPAADEAHQM